MFFKLKKKFSKKEDLLMERFWVEVKISHFTDRLIPQENFSGDDLKFSFSFYGLVVANSCNP